MFPNFPVDDVTAVAVEQRGQEVKGAAKVHVADIGVPMTMRGVRLDKAGSLPAGVRVHARTLSPSKLLSKLIVRDRPGHESFRFWQQGPGYDRTLWTPIANRAAIDCIHESPVIQGAFSTGQAMEVVESAVHAVFMNVSNGSWSISSRGDHPITRTRADAVTQGNVARVFVTASCLHRSSAVIVIVSRLHWSDSSLTFSRFCRFRVEQRGAEVPSWVGLERRLSPVSCWP